MTLRWARSPVAPNRTRHARVRDALEAEALAERVVVGPGRRLALALAGEPEVAHRPRRVLGPRRGVGLLVRARSRARPSGASGSADVFAPLRDRGRSSDSLGLHRVAAELVAERGEDLRAVGVVLARAEAGQQRQGDDRRRDVVVDRLLDRPAALAGVGDLALEVLEVLAVRLERPGRPARAATTGRPSPASRGRRSRPGRAGTTRRGGSRSPRRTPASGRTRSRCGPSSRSGRRRPRRRGGSRPPGRAT